MLKRPERIDFPGTSVRETSHARSTPKTPAIAAVVQLISSVEKAAWKTSEFMCLVQDHFREFRFDLLPGVEEILQKLGIPMHRRAVLVGFQLGPRLRSLGR